MTDRELLEGGGPAYPLLLPDGLGGDFAPGMSLRDRFAMAALTGITSACYDNPLDDAVMSKWAWSLADAMMKERKSNES